MNLTSRFSELQLQQVIPLFFSPRPGSTIWGQDVHFSATNSIQISGPSGSGKSTLFRFMLGQSGAYSGQFNVLRQNGKSEPVFQSKPDKNAHIYRQHIAHVPQDLRMIPHLSIRENLLLKARLGMWNSKMQSFNFEFVAFQNRIEQLATQFGIYPMLTKRADSVSRGELQRATILRALLQPFDFLLLDEAFSHLDINRSQEIAHIIRQECCDRAAGLISFDLAPDNLFAYGARYEL